MANLDIKKGGNNGVRVGGCMWIYFAQIVCACGLDLNQTRMQIVNLHSS